VIVVAMSRANRAIGHGDGLLWHVPADLKRFKALTHGHPIIMGRRTFESILKILGKPLPGRTNIVITRDTNAAYEGARVAHSLEEAIAIAQEEHPTEIHIGGGAQVYKEALPLVSKIFATWFYDEKEADTYFPEFEDEFTITCEHPREIYEGLSYQWIDYERKRS
jgi:dihydrofolate reductase